MIRLALMLFLAAMATPAIAQPGLLSATPVPDSRGASPTTIELRFDERLIPRMSNATLAMTGMGGAAHAPMGVAGTKASVTPGGNGLTMTLAKPLVPGIYRVEWHAMSGKGGHSTGSYAFTVE